MYYLKIDSLVKSKIRSLDAMQEKAYIGEVEGVFIMSGICNISYRLFTFINKGYTVKGGYKGFT